LIHTLDREQRDRDALILSIEVIMFRASDIHSPPRLAELFPPEAIRVGLGQHTKSEVIAELVHQAVAVGHLPSRAEVPIVDAILERESLGSTALGHGVAFPHCRWRSLDRLVGVVGLLPRGIPFDATDGEPVDTVFLTLAPLEEPEPYYEVMGRLVAIGRDEGRHLLLSRCRTVEQVSAFFAELDQPVVGRLDELARMSLSRRDPERTDPRRELAILGLAPADPSGRQSPERRWL
jgi:nitrogen PTS system EIIA component